MKLAKKVRRYCPKCKRHTDQEISVAKKKDRGSLKKGSLQRGKKRGRGRNFGNKGRWGSKPAISKYKRTGAKQSKKQDLRYKCKTCGKITVQAKGTRSKKLELK
ncbi:MAG: 50S ribosomal protein L44e [Candidatus Woesearchaeota archaeon]